MSSLPGRGANVIRKNKLNNSNGKTFFCKCVFIRVILYICRKFFSATMAEKVKFEMEFPMNVSTPLLYQYISTSSGLAEWFAENVISRGEVFTFVWNGEQEKARMIAKKSSERVKFRWVD